ncbi:hypothetical protein C8F04DRAFT_1047764 [Mycena alexandri]|uniref:Uncharacterized protein n=1 Tax=Mycena alexandri TaxID=1745969 RepID=A0AAD6SA13_9AGAR|nr:hypothetical protein C8F04DRAFT_1047764 [Mycena alexandri]
MDLLGVVGVSAGAVAIPLSAVSASTAVAAISQGASQQSGAGGGGGGEPAKDDPRLAKFSVKVSCEDPGRLGKELDGKIVVLRNKKLYLDDSDPQHRMFEDGHPFSGFFIDYPVGKKELGLVSTISKDPPELNWIYADSDTLELKYGNKTASEHHIPGPWDWTDDQTALTLDEWEGFVAAEESPGVWVVHYDRDDDHLKGVRGSDKSVVEVGLERRILK